jgi:DNA mismatch repair protein MutS
MQRRRQGLTPGERAYSVAGVNRPLPIAAKPDPAETAATPVMAQYFEAKARQPGALIFFRMGDFYELFFDDAHAAAGALGITLTHRGSHAGKPIPMAGVPTHTADAYLAKLIRAGFKVAVCEQMEPPEAARKRGAKSIVRRDLVRVVTPGTLTEDSLLEAKGSNRLAAVAVRAGRGAVASVELSTGEVECLEAPPSEFISVLAGLRPSEILVTDRLLADPTIKAGLEGLGIPVELLAGALAEPAAAEARLKRLYGLDTLDSFGEISGAEMAALGLIGAHLEITQPGATPALRAPRRRAEQEFMIIDPATRAGLEIEASYSGSRQGSLLFAVDRTLTAPGARLLASRLARPLTTPSAIAARLDCVEWLLERADLRERLRGALKTGGDMARALSRLALGRGGPRDLERLRDGLAGGEKISALFRGEEQRLGTPPGDIAAALEAITPGARPVIAALLEALRAGLASEPPALARDGGYVTQGFRAELDEARSLRDDSRKVLATLEKRLAGETGVALKIKHNAVLGYFVEASARQAEPLLRDPWRAAFLHRQTLANQVRFTTAELAQLDAAIAEAGERALAIEVSTFEAWRDQATSLAAEIHAAADALALLDVAAGLAEWAKETKAVRPSIDLSLALDARGARHPVVETAVRRQGEAFVPNDCALDGAGVDAARLAIVTGPNMAGKSTFLRQNALLCILAQAGAFVPAKSFRLGIVDRLFSRVGAADDLARGRSTFMAEMIEAAAILNQATDRSFVILDEIGRGTATYDGLAIAWACVEALHDVNRCRTLFATHYHELAALEERLAYVHNLSLRAKEWNGELVFLHEAAPGPADRSYGVQVARLAGVPAPVVARARQVLERLERRSDAHVGLQELPLFAAAIAAETPTSSPSPMEAAIAALDLDGMSPREAMDTLYRLKASLESPPKAEGR